MSEQVKKLFDEYQKFCKEYINLDEFTIENYKTISEEAISKVEEMKKIMIKIRWQVKKDIVKEKISSIGNFLKRFFHCF